MKSSNINPSITPTNPSFFKILLNSSASNLSLPLDFDEEILGKVPENTRIGVKSGKSWDVKLEEADGTFSFGNGWLKFVSDNKLGNWDFLVFWLEGDFTFQVAIFGPDGCEKKLGDGVSADSIAATVALLENQIKTEDEGNGEIHATESNEQVLQKAGPDRLMHPPLQRNISKKCKYSLGIPGGLLKVIGIQKGRETVVRDGNGREWPAWLSVASSGCGKLCGGWPQLCKANKLLPGDTCFIYFMGNETGLTHILVLKKLKKRGLVIETANEGDEEVIGIREEKQPYPSFQTVLKKWHKFGPSVPDNFLHEAGVRGERKMVLWDDERRRWGVQLRALSRFGTTYKFSSGWANFWNGNRLKVGNTCDFQFIRIEGDSIHVDVTVKGERRGGKQAPR